MKSRPYAPGYGTPDGEPFSGARQFPTHGTYSKYGIVNLSNVVGTQVPQAAGVALASKMRGEDTVTIVYFGDGATSSGDCHEGMNFAGIHKLPVIFFCENNGYAISVPLAKQMAVANVADRAEAYGMPGVTIDGCDIAAVYEATAEAAARARTGEGPTLIEARVERYLPHTSDDDDRRYRSLDEIKEARKRDPYRTGLTAVQAEELTRDAVFNALRERRCYGTSGVKILLDLEVDGFPMGSAARTVSRPAVGA